MTNVAHAAGRHSPLTPLFAEPVRNNPAKWIGSICACGLLLKANGSISEPEKAINPKLPRSGWRPSLGHAARVRAADRMVSGRIEALLGRAEAADTDALDQIANELAEAKTNGTIRRFTDVDEIRVAAAADA